MRTVGSFLAVWFCVSLFVAGSLRAENLADRKQDEVAAPAAKAVATAPVPAFYDDFSDGRWEKRTGKDPWDRALPEWKHRGAKEGLDASKGYLSYTNSKWNTFWIPSKVAYGTWEYKYRFSGGRTTYGGAAMKKLNVAIISPKNARGWGDSYVRAVASDGHSWFTRPGGHPGHHLLHNEKGGWGTGLFVDNRWHVCRVTRDPKKGFTVYHDNRIITSGYKAGNPRDNGKDGLFTEVKDDTLKTSSELVLSLMAGNSPGSVDIDDITIYDVVIPAPTDTPLWELYAIGEGKNTAKLPVVVNYAGAKMGAKASGSAGEKAAATASRNMIDGVTTDYSGGAGFGYSVWPEYLTVQLKQTRPIEEIYLSLWDFTAPLMSRKSPGPRKYDFEVDVSVDGKTWTNVARRDKAVQLQRISIGGRNVRYIRMRGKHYREYQHGKYPTPPKVQRVVDEFYVVEVEAYGATGK